MRKQNHPLVANEVVELDGTVGGLSLEVGGDAAQAKRSVCRVGHCDCV